MKIAMPMISEEQISDHFGHSKMFLIAEVNEDEIQDLKYYDAPEHAFGSLPMWLISMGVDVLLCKGLGQKAVEILNSRNVQVFANVIDSNPVKAIKSYLEGNLGKSDTFCSGSGNCH